MARASFLVVYLLGILIFVIVSISSEFLLFNSAASNSEIAASLIFFDYFIIEACIVAVISLWLINTKSKLLRFSGYIVTTLFITINFIQMVAIKRGGEFLSRLALENSNHVSIIATGANFISIIELFFLCLLLPFIIEKKFPQISNKKIQFSITLIFSMCILMLFHSDKLIAKEVFDSRDHYLENHNMRHTSPSLAIYEALFNDYLPDISANFNDKEIKELRKYGFSFDVSSPYPLLKDAIYNGEVPFETQKVLPKQLNVIVFFAEGFSARTMNAYGSKFKELTPNLDEFSKYTMIVENYYNHTAATYRGLHGQLCSLYPFFGGNGGWSSNYKDLPERNYLCLNHIFKQNDYETYFFDSHRKDNAFVDELARDLDFEHVLTAEELSQTYLQGREPGRDFSLTDTEFYESFVQFLEARKTSDNPFFASLYNLETHAFIDINGHGKSYGDGKNNSLNTIHNLDYAFGKFWQYFKNSSYADNTVVIFTSDHAHYTEKSYTEAFDAENYQRMFIDKIPLLIYDPTRKLPPRYDAKNSTSIDFAPSLIHYLGFKNRANPFLGTSFFATNRKDYDEYGIASFGDDFYFIADKIYSMNTSSAHKEKLELISKFIKVTQKSEINNRLWKEQAY